MSTTPQPLFLSDDAFELLVRRVPAEVLREVPDTHFEQVIGTTRERFTGIVEALSADNRVQGFLGPETAGYLRNALGIAILECEPQEFLERTGIERDDAVNLMRQISYRIDGKAPEAN